MLGDCLDNVAWALDSAVYTHAQHNKLWHFCLVVEKFWLSRSSCMCKHGCDFPSLQFGWLQVKKQHASWIGNWLFTHSLVLHPCSVLYIWNNCCNYECTHVMNTVSDLAVWVHIGVCTANFTPSRHCYFFVHVIHLFVSCQLVRPCQAITSCMAHVHTSYCSKKWQGVCNFKVTFKCTLSWQPQTTVLLPQ